MKKLFIGIFMLSIVGLFAAVTFNNDPIPAKILPVKMDANKSPNHKTDLYSDLAQKIAECYGVPVTDVFIPASAHFYTILSIPYTTSIVWTSCTPSPCSIGCTRVYPDFHECCFQIPWDVH